MNQVQGSIFIGLTGLKFCYDCPLMKTIVAFGILDVVLLGAGAALFATGIVTNNADLTLSGIVLLAMAIVTTVILYFVCCATQSRPKILSASQTSSRTPSLSIARELRGSQTSRNWSELC